MAYCTVGDVQPYLTHVTLSATSQPTKEEVSRMCDHVASNIIDPIIRNYASLPITDDHGLNYLRQGSIYYVLASVNRGFFGATEIVLNLEDKFNKFLERLETNNALLMENNASYPKTAHNTLRARKYTTDHNEDIW